MSKEIKSKHHDKVKKLTDLCCITIINNLNIVKQHLANKYLSNTDNYESVRGEKFRSVSTYIAALIDVKGSIRCNKPQQAIIPTNKQGKAQRSKPTASSKLRNCSANGHTKQEQNVGNSIQANFTHIFKYNQGLNKFITYTATYKLCNYREKKTVEYNVMLSDIVSYLLLNYVHRFQDLFLLKSLFPQSCNVRHLESCFEHCRDLEENSRNNYVCNSIAISHTLEDVVYAEYLEQHDKLIITTAKKGIWFVKNVKTFDGMLEQDVNSSSLFLNFDFYLKTVPPGTVYSNWRYSPSSSVTRNYTPTTPSGTIVNLSDVVPEQNGSKKRKFDNLNFHSPLGCSPATSPTGYSYTYDSDADSLHYESDNDGSMSVMPEYKRRKLNSFVSESNDSDIEDSYDSFSVTVHSSNSRQSSPFRYGDKGLTIEKQADRGSLIFTKVFSLEDIISFSTKGYVYRWFMHQEDEFVKRWKYQETGPYDVLLLGFEDSKFVVEECNANSIVIYNYGSGRRFVHCFNWSVAAQASMFPYGENFLVPIQAMLQQDILIFNDFFRASGMEVIFPFHGNDVYDSTPERVALLNVYGAVCIKNLHSNRLELIGEVRKFISPFEKDLRIKLWCDNRFIVWNNHHCWIFYYGNLNTSSTSIVLERIVTPEVGSFRDYTIIDLILNSSNFYFTTLVMVQTKENRNSFSVQRFFNYFSASSTVTLASQIRKFLYL